MINKLQSLKGRTKLKFKKIISNYYDEMNIRSFKFEADHFPKMLKVLVKLIAIYYC